MTLAAAAILYPRLRPPGRDALAELDDLHDARLRSR
jgi:hypothetical protein